MILLLSSLVWLSACGIPDVPQSKQIKPVIVDTTYVSTKAPIFQNRSITYNFINRGDSYYIRKATPVVYTDSTIVYDNVEYLYVDRGTLAKPAESGIYTRVSFSQTENALRIGRTTLYIQIPSLQKHTPITQKDVFLNGPELVVQKGYNLNYIATKYNIPVTDLYRLNNLTPSSIIYPGQVIKLY